MNLKKSLPLILIFIFSACGKENEKSHKDYETKEISSTLKERAEDFEFKVDVRRKVELHADESNYLKFKENINTHQVEFESLNGQVIGAEVVCSKGIIKNIIRTYNSKFDIHGEKAVINLQLASEDKNETEFNCEILNNTEVIYSKVISLKKSYIISKSEILQNLGISNSSIGTLLLEKGGEISTFGANTVLEMDELISFGGDISTFPKSNLPTTLKDTHGLGGGNIVIKANSSKGKITFNLIGLDGGIQTKVPAPIKDIPKFTNDLHGNCKGFKYTDSNYVSDTKCFGEKGHKGFKGQKGFPGYDGGSSGSVHYLQNNMSNIGIRIIYSPGKGTSGGEGGMGGKGSKGGIGSVVEIHERRESRPNCPLCKADLLKASYPIGKHKYPDGEIGDQGDKGEYGSDGLIGLNDKSFIEFKNESELTISNDFDLEGGL